MFYPQPAWHNFIRSLIKIIEKDEIIMSNKREYFRAIGEFTKSELNKYNARLNEDYIEFVNKEDMIEFVLKWA
jgi:hypothetical protein